MSVIMIMIDYYNAILLAVGARAPRAIAIVPALKRSRTGEDGSPKACVISIITLSTSAYFTLFTGNHLK